MMKKIIIGLLCVLSFTSLAGESLPTLILEKEFGGRLDGSSWSSAEIKNKVHVLFYVDPDEKDLNERVADVLQNAKFPLDKYGSIAVINMAATWLPNFAIATSLKEKQKKFPDTLYLKDFNKLFIKTWGLKDDSSNILLFDKSGMLLMKIMGKATEQEEKKLLGLIKDNL
jgi:predicted transcriptional regulator